LSEELNSTRDKTIFLSGDWAEEWLQPRRQGRRNEGAEPLFPACLLALADIEQFVEWLNV